MMHRNCPVCNSRRVSGLPIVLGARTRCRDCGTRLGVHWLLATTFALLTPVLVAFFVLWLLGLKLPLLMTIGLAFGALTVIAALEASFAPLEPKGSSWEP